MLDIPSAYFVPLLVLLYLPCALTYEHADILLLPLSVIYLLLFAVIYELVMASLLHFASVSSSLQ